MNALHIHWSAWPVIGGIERHLRDVLLDDKDAFLLAGNQSSRERYYFYDGLFFQKQFDEMDFRTAYSFIPHHDVVHIHNPHILSPEKTKIICKSIKKPKVASIHNLSPRLQDMSVLEGFDEVLVYSQFMHEQVPNTTIVPCYFKTNANTSLESDNILLQPTRISKWKGSHLSLEAAALLLDEGLNFTFIHAGNSDKLFDSVFNISERVKKYVGSEILLHSYEPEELTKLIASSAGVVHPTIGVGVEGEPLSLSAVEAILCGKPLICTASGNLKYLAANYSRAAMVEPSVESVANAMRKILTINSPLLPSDIQFAKQLRQNVTSGLSAYSRIYGLVSSRKNP